MIGTDGFQETPIVEVTRQITKHNYLVLDVNDLPRIMKEVCIRLVQSGDAARCRRAQGTCIRRSLHCVCEGSTVL